MDEEINETQGVFRKKLVTFEITQISQRTACVVKKKLDFHLKIQKYPEENKPLSTKAATVFQNTKKHFK